MGISCDHCIAIAGVFDIANYGDQLFPLVAAHRLESYGIKPVAIAPVAQENVRSDALRPHDLHWLATTDNAIDAVLIGGGNILYNLRADYTAIWQLDRSKFGRGQHTGLWLGASIAAAIRDVPFGFNAPGIPYPFSSAVSRDVLTPVLMAADVVAVRDEASARLARPAYPAVTSVPDTAIDISRMWPLSSLMPAWRDIGARLGWTDRPYAAFHLRAKPGDDARIIEVSRQIDAFCIKQNLDAVLVAIGDDLGDGATARALQAAMATPATIVDGTASLREVAATIAHARLFMGGSLHGYITAAAYAVPGVIVTDHPQAKFAGFLDWMERPDDLARSWTEACRAMSARLQLSSRPQVPTAVGAALDRHWQSVAEMVHSPARRRRERAAFLRQMTGRSVDRHGMNWLLDAFGPTLRSEAPV